MGCNAWNHPLNCNCGWGGDTGGGRGGGGLCSSPLLQGTKIDGLISWGRIASGSFKSYINPNAHCPVCGASVYFYQSVHGGRVFFDELGPPWPKHPCTDSGTPPSGPRSASGQKKKGRQSKRFRPRNFRDYSQPISKQGLRTEEQARFAFLASGWHPLLQVNVTQLEKGWKQVIGIDGVTHQRCSIITKGNFQNWAPTFINVSKPERLKCNLQQAVVFAGDEFTLVTSTGWFGAYSLDEARVSKQASEGDPGAMYRAAEFRSIRFLRSDDALPHVERWVDVDAARYWFKRSAQSGFVPAVLGGAYLEDLIQFGEKVYPRHDKRDFLETAVDGILELQADIDKAKTECDEDTLEWEFDAAFSWFGYSFEEWENRKNVVHLAGAVKRIIAKWKKDLGIEASS